MVVVLMSCDDPLCQYCCIRGEAGMLVGLRSRGFRMGKGREIGIGEIGSFGILRTLTLRYVCSSI